MISEAFLVAERMDINNYGDKEEYLHSMFRSQHSSEDLHQIFLTIVPKTTPKELKQLTLAISNAREPVDCL